MTGRAAHFLKCVVMMTGVWMAGCAHWAGGRVYESPRVQEGKAPLGRVKVIVAGNPWDGQEKTAKVEAVVTEVVGGAKGATVVAPEVRKATEAMGDRDALLAAKTAGAERVCVVTIASYGGMFAIGVPELWATQTRVLYSLRVLDVESGDLLLESVSFCQDGGPWEVVNPTEYENSLRALLRRDMGPWIR